MELTWGGDFMDYSYEQLEEDIDMGHEIEFIYMGDELF